jgi:uncharacterized peroxidase-related enzyme
MFIKTIAPEEATGAVADIYQAEKAAHGFVMSATACWTARPDFLPLWEDFYAKMKANFSLTPRDWRLITFAAAQQVPSTYCSTVYGRQIVADLGSKEAVLALQRDGDGAGLSAREAAMVVHAGKIANNASTVMADDIEVLRGHGFSDVQIADIALCASIRCFMARYFDAVGAGPEQAFLDEDETFRNALAVGRGL